jgi:signal transduction histidine kinase
MAPTDLADKVSPRYHSLYCGETRSGEIWGPKRTILHLAHPNDRHALAQCSSQVLPISDRRTRNSQSGLEMISLNSDSQSEGLNSQGIQALSNQQLGAALSQVLLDIEQERSALVRNLHDELGGLLVGALMDLSWIAQQDGPDAPKNQKLKRATDLLRQAIDLKRELIEVLKPTLLANIGLFSALRWHLKSQCDAAAVTYTESYPDEEVLLEEDVKTGIFRILEGMLRHELSEGTLNFVSLNIDTNGGMLDCRLECEHCASQGEAPAGNSARVDVMQFRAGALGGIISSKASPQVHHFRLHIPASAGALTSS